MASIRFDSKMSAFLFVCALQAACSAGFKTKSALSSASQLSVTTPSPSPNPSPTPTPTPTQISGGPGCGLTQAAFCETFDEGASETQGRGGDLDPKKWTLARLAPPDLSGFGPVADPVRIGPIPVCKSSLSQGSVYPPYDTLICDPDANGNRQLMTAAVVQNYGNNSYMIEQPFDFAGRTGKIVFDVEAYYQAGLGAYPAIDITEDPVPAPTFQEFHNFEAGPIPRNGVMLKIADGCNTSSNGSYGSMARLANLVVYDNYLMTIVTPSFQVADAECMNVKQGFLNHIEIDISQTHIDVYGSDYSADGINFPASRLIYSADISVPFSRGYIHMAARNHATIKYGYGPDGTIHWDNIGFDGPVVPASRFYEVADNSTMGTYSNYEGAAIMNLGYLLRDGTTGAPAGMYDPIILLPPLQIQAVSITGATTAQLSMNAFFNTVSHTADATWGLVYRFNGGTWRTHNLTPAELAEINYTPPLNPDPGPAGNVLLLFDVPLTDLINGINTVEFRVVNAPQDYPPVVANIDLILSP